MVVDCPCFGFCHEPAKAVFRGNFESACRSLLFPIHDRGSGQSKVYSYLGDYSQPLCRICALEVVARFTWWNHLAWKIRGGCYHPVDYSRRPPRFLSDPQPRPTRGTKK